RRSADDTAARGDGVQLVVVLDDARPDQVATLAVVLDGQNTLTAAALDRVVLHRGALGVTTRGSDQQVGALLDDVEREQLVLAVEPHALHTGGRAAHRTQRLVGGRV